MKYIKPYKIIQTSFKIGDYVRFSKKSERSKVDSPYYNNDFFRIIHIGNKDGNALNRNIAIRPISNLSNSLTYLSGDYINITPNELELLADYEVASIKYNII